ncbi:hypothetical protein, partial [Verminephrobacter aporrectodeae]|uniref:hypothetical protein n=1 Tax=Verminephrobacter aporrectodeae TaxID=1110389 RepID=UPI00224419DB
VAWPLSPVGIGCRTLAVSAFLPCGMFLSGLRGALRLRRPIRAQGGPQAVHARVRSRATGLGAFVPSDGGDALVLGIGGDADLVMLRSTREALFEAAQALHK